MSLLASAFRKTVSKLKDTRMKMESEFNVGYPTGFLGFDFTNGTVIHTKINGQPFKYYQIGITDGSMVMIVGRSGCGKTSWAVQTAANIVRPFENSAIFHDDIEAGITEARKMKLTRFSTEEIESKYIHRNTGITAENFYERIKMIRDIKAENRAEYEYDTGYYDERGNRIFKLQPTVYLLDSLALLMPSKFTEEDELSGSMAASAVAKANASIFKRITAMLKEVNIILLIINHINAKIDINPMAKTKSQVSYLKQDESLPGGNSPIYLSNLLLRFDNNTKLKEGEGLGIAGNYVDITLVKSRTARAGSIATLVFDQENGYDADLSLFLMLKEEKLVNGAGAYLYLGDRDDKKFSQKQLKTKLAEDEEFREIFENLCLECLRSKLSKQEELREYDSELKATNNIMSKINCIPA